MSAMTTKVLVLGHGRFYLRNHLKPRCAPIDCDRWDELVTTNAHTNLTFIDIDMECEPDIVVDVGDEWSNLVKDNGTYDYVIDAITHLCIPQRHSLHYWNGVMSALKSDGQYLGWRNQSNALSVIDRRMWLDQQSVVEYVSRIRRYFQ